MNPSELVVDLASVSLQDVAQVGGKNASLGEMMNHVNQLGVRVPSGFAITATAYRKFINTNGLADRLRELLAEVDVERVASLEAVAEKARRTIIETALPKDLIQAINEEYKALTADGHPRSLAVRSSATAEDLPNVSFAGQHSTFLNVKGKEELLTAVKHCFASLFTARAIDYRIRNGFDHFQVALSVGIQQMVRSDLGCSGVIFTLDTESGFRGAVLVTGVYGLGETIVQGQVNPDEWVVFKPTLRAGYEAIVERRLGTKERELVFESNSGGTRLMPVDPSRQSRFCLTDSEVEQLAKWACAIEAHYSQRAGMLQAMDIEWAKDGETGELYVVQARPETVHNLSAAPSAYTYRLTGAHAEPLVTGQAVGERVGSGPVRIVTDVADLSTVSAGDVLVSPSTDPDWEPVMKRVSAIVTDHGGRTSHAAIVSREIGVPCIVGAGDATKVLHNGQVVTISCAEGEIGHVYADAITFELVPVDHAKAASTRTGIMLNVGDPSRVFTLASLPCAGVGLARMEFIISSSIGVHPMALCRFPRLTDSEDVRAIQQLVGSDSPTEFFIRRLSEGLAKICAAFYPRPVIVRVSDFKTNEYARLLGGAEFEPVEENPMLGFRGASRYYDPRYAEAFDLECRALARVREAMGLKNLKVMIPFCRTPEEADRVLERMADNGLRRHVDGLEVYVMCELPSNALQADAFFERVDGFSIGSNDLTQMVLGVDRDSSTVTRLFNEQDPSVKACIAQAISAAHRNGKPIGICGQAPSDYPEFAAWLVEQGITSISVNPDAFYRTVSTVADAEKLKVVKEKKAHVK